VILLQTNPQTKDKPMKRNLQIIGGVVAVLVGLGFIMPAVAQLRAQGASRRVPVAGRRLGRPSRRQTAKGLMADDAAGVLQAGAGQKQPFLRNPLWFQP
jgi:hypothetical protein